jgi:hypothetical protein
MKEKNYTDDFRQRMMKLLAGKEHIFRQDDQRESIDGTNASVLSNFDSKGQGPKNRFFIGRKVAYPTADYIEWVCSRVKSA